MTKTVSKNQVISSLMWKLIERGGNQSISFLVSLVLARLLTPEDYGLVALILVFTTFANVFVQSGFSTSLIQKKEVSETDYSTAFTCSLLIALVLYIAIFLTAPTIAIFYDDARIALILRVFSLTLFAGAINSVQVAIVSRNMSFKILFRTSTIAVIMSGLIGIILAYCGYGVWALIAQQLLNQIIVIILLFIHVKWKPTFYISITSLKELFGFGSNILVTNLLATTFINLRSLLIGKIFNPSILGFYNRGMQFPAAFVANINGSIQSVMLPAYSSHQDDTKVIRSMVRRSIKMSSFIIFPMMIGLAVIAEPLILLLLTEKWLSSVIYVQIYCAVYSIMPLHTANLLAIKALGHSGTILKLEIIKKTIDVVVLVVSIPFGVFMIALGELLTGLISTVINSYPNKKYLDYSYKEQWIDILPSLLLALLMGATVYFFKYLNFNSNVALIVLQITVGVFVYFMLAYLLKFEEVDYLRSLLKNHKSKR